MWKAVLFLCLFFGAFAQDAVSADPPPEKKLAAESYWKFHHSAYIGYRRDRQKFHSFGSGILHTRTQIKNRNTVQLTASSHLEFKSVVGHLQASYGWLMGGQTHFKSFDNVPPLSFDSFKLGAGYNVEVAGALAWRFHLYSHPNFKFSFLPGIGYRYAHMMNDPKGINRFSLPGTQNFAYCQFPKPNQQDWFGFFVDGRVEFLSWDFFLWSFFCQYHQPYLVSKSNNRIEIYDYNASGALISDQAFQINTVMKASDLHMVLAGTHLKFLFGPGWSIGTYFEGSTTWKGARNHVKLRQEQFLTAPVAGVNTQSKDSAALRWTFYSLSIMVDSRF